VVSVHHIGLAAPRHTTRLPGRVQGDAGEREVHPLRGGSFARSVDVKAIGLSFSYSHSTQPVTTKGAFAGTILTRCVLNSRRAHWSS
jgi:hypothetical protein